MKRLSDLEMAILGIILKRAPCTAYVVAKEFAESPSSHWRGSAGTVYPAIQRLGQLRLVQRRRATRLGRPCELLALSAMGQKALRAWLTPPLPDAAAAITYDPIRTRAFFLACLTPDVQRQFLADAERQSRAQLTRLEDEVQRYRRLGDWFSEHAQRGAVLAMQSRIQWLGSFQEQLASRSISSPSA